MSCKEKVIVICVTIAILPYITDEVQLKKCGSFALILKLLSKEVGAVSTNVAVILE